MVGLDSMQMAVMQVAIQAAIVAVMSLKEADTGPTTGVNMAKAGEMHRPRHGGPALRQPAFNWETPDECIELLNFEMEETNILQARAYKLNDDEKSL